jgi:DNA-dependent protein kinase catalytic subunit
MSPNAEAFLTLRTECAKSLAVSNLFGYILGLGDRHLDNLLLDEKTGCIVQIDFGICFGMGTSVLGVPELLPFRLTRQLTGLFRPLDSKKLLRHYMIGVLRPLRY